MSQLKDDSLLGEDFENEMRRLEICSTLSVVSVQGDEGGEMSQSQTYFTNLISELKAELGFESALYKCAPASSPNPTSRLVCSRAHSISSESIFAENAAQTANVATNHVIERQRMLIEVG